MRNKSGLVAFIDNPLTRKSTPMVELDSSSGSHCSSENLKSRLLFPTEELPISKSLQLTGGDEDELDFEAMVLRRGPLCRLSKGYDRI